MSKNAIAFTGFVCALNFGGVETALKISVSTVCVLLVSWLSVKLPFLFDRWTNTLFVVVVWSAAAQIILSALGTPEKEMLLCFAANLSVMVVLSHEFKEITCCSAIIIILSVLIGWIPLISSAAFGFIASGLVVSLLSRRQRV